MGSEKAMQVAFNENTSTTSTSTISTSLTPNFDNLVTKAMRKEFKAQTSDVVELCNIENTTKPKQNQNATTQEQVLEAYSAQGAYASLQIKKEKLSDSEN